MGPVAAVAQSASDVWPPVVEMFARVLHRASFDANTSPVALLALSRARHVPSGQLPPQQVIGPAVGLRMPSQCGFIARKATHPPSPHSRHIYVAWPLTTRATQFIACSPWPAPPRMRFVYLDSRLTLHASYPRSVARTQLRFTSLAVVSSRKDSHLQDRAHAGRTTKKAAWRAAWTGVARAGQFAALAPDAAAGAEAAASGAFGSGKFAPPWLAI